MRKIPEHLPENPFRHPGKNLIDVEFDPYDVMNSENHKALMHLRETGLKDEEAVQNLCPGSFPP